MPELNLKEYRNGSSAVGVQIEIENEIPTFIKNKLLNKQGNQ